VAQNFSANEWVGIAADHLVSRDDIAPLGSARTGANARIGLRIIGFRARVMLLDVSGLAVVVRFAQVSQSAPDQRTKPGTRPGLCRSSV
jgi:hypothetical protein